MSAGQHGQPDDRILVHPDQAAGLANPTILLEMVQHGHGLVLGKLAAVQGGALAFREALLTGSARQHPGRSVGSVAEADAQIVQAALAVGGAFGVLAAEVFQVIHSSFGLPNGTKKLPCSCIYRTKQLRRRQA